MFLLSIFNSAPKIVIDEIIRLILIIFETSIYKFQMKCKLHGF